MQRLYIAVGIGVVAGLVAGRFASWAISLLVGYDAGVIYVVATIVVLILRFDTERTRASATREDDSRFAAQFALLCASGASLAATAAGLVQAGHREGAEKAFLTAICLATVVLSWTVVHCIFTLRYAHLYYTPPIGGVDFKNDDPPDYRDFAYLAMTVGMTYQVSDTDIQSRPIRRTVLRHALISYVFGVAILGVVVNSIAGLLG
jgi:uncharacterized membrane protein